MRSRKREHLTPEPNEEHEERERGEREHESTRARSGLWRFESKFGIRRCGECPPCLAKKAPCASGVSRAALPCELWLSSAQYTSSERLELLQLLRAKRPDHKYGFASQEDLCRYITSQQDV